VAIKEMTEKDNGQASVATLRAGAAIAISGGSFEDSQGTAAFVIKGDSSTGCVAGDNLVPGDAEESQSPCESKLGGVTGVLKCLHGICITHATTKGHVEIGPDGNQARKEAFVDWPLNPSGPDFDLLVHVRNVIRLLPLTFTSRWIEGHQDDSQSSALLNRRRKFNVKCDGLARGLAKGLAKGFWNADALAKTWAPSVAFGLEKWALWIGKKKLS
jgi:hypothetical protein